MSDSPRCPVCRGEHASEAQALRCRLDEANRAELWGLASSLDQPPTLPQVVDLYAHARALNDDGFEAKRWVAQVLHLGWRPVVGGVR